MNLDALLEPISLEHPAGEDCGYSVELQAIDGLVEYLGERAVVEELRRQARRDFSGENEASDRRNAEAFLADGERKVDALAATCKELLGRNASPALACEGIIERANELLTRRGKDLRVVKGLATAWTHDRGLAGLQDGVLLLEQLIQRFPDHLHPQADEDDPSDLSARAMVVSEMVAGRGFVHLLRECALLTTAAGSIAMRDADVLDGLLDPDPDRPASREQFIGVVRLALAAEQGARPDAITGDALRQRIEQLREPLLVTSEAMHRVCHGFDRGLVRGDAVAALLERMARHLGDLADQQAAAVASAAVHAALVSAGDSATAPGSGSVLTVDTGVASGMRLQTREDARRQILQVCAFLEHLEPSHPAPLFLRRAERLLGARNYFEIVRDMTPDAIDEVTRITGHRPPDDTA